MYLWNCCGNIYFFFIFMLRLECVSLPQLFFFFTLGKTTKQGKLGLWYSNAMVAPFSLHQVQIGWKNLCDQGYFFTRNPLLNQSRIENYNQGDVGKHKFGNMCPFLLSMLKQTILLNFFYIEPIKLLLKTLKSFYS